MIKRIISLLTCLILIACTVKIPVKAGEYDFALDISSQSQAAFGQVVTVDITLNKIAANTAIIGFDIYDLSYDSSVLKMNVADFSVSVDDWQVDISDLSERYGRGYAKIMATVSATDVTSAQITQDGVFKLSIPFEVIGVPTSNNTQISIGTELTGVNAYYDAIVGGSDNPSASIDIFKSPCSVAPVAPIVIAKDSSSVTLKAIDGYEYSKDGRAWQNSNVFTGLNQDTKYVFRQRIAETDTHLASGIKSISTYTLLKMTDYTYGVMGGQIRTNGKYYDLRFISNISRDFVENKLPNVAEFGVLMARADQCGEDMLTVELAQTADYTVKTVPINYLSTVYSTSSTYTFTATILSVSDFDRTYVVRPYFVLNGNTYYTTAQVGRCINDGLR